MKGYGLVAGLPVRYKVTRTTSTDMFFVTLLAGICFQGFIMTEAFRKFPTEHLQWDIS